MGVCTSKDNVEMTDLAEMTVATIPSERRVMHDKYVDMLKKSGWSGFDAFGGKITKEDVLIIVDMQNDFLPEDVAPEGGRFAVAEGGSTLAPIVRLIEAFSQADAKIVATRDYHPHDHCSFNCNGGPFPAHCVQGSAGSYFHPVIGDALKRCMGARPALQRGKSFDHKAKPSPVPQNTNGKVEIAFKGFAEKVDSFGAFKYKKPYFGERGNMAGPYFAWDVKDSPSGITCAESWTGSFCLKCSSALEDINAPPDVMAIKHTDIRALEDVVQEHPTGRVVVCGLALDVCCQDTCVNAAQAGYKQVSLVLDASRAVNLPGIGQYEGYTTDPAWLTSTWKDLGIKIVDSASVLA